MDWRSLILWALKEIQPIYGYLSAKNQSVKAPGDTWYFGFVLDFGEDIVYICEFVHVFVVEGLD